MSTSPEVEPFEGKDWEECCDFIVAVRSRARYEGKLRDPEWMADLATVSFYGKALLWHAHLPRDVRADWEKLEVALLERWSPSDSDDEKGKIEPTPAAAPFQSLNALSNHSAQGLIRVIPAGSSALHYLKHESGTNLVRCTDHRTEAIPEALQLRLDAVPGTDLFHIYDTSSRLFLAFYWGPGVSVGKLGSFAFATVKMLHPATLELVPRMSAGSWKVLTCTLSPSRELIPVWSEDDGARKQLTAFVSKPKVLYLAVDSAAYARRCSTETTARLVFESYE